MVLFRKEGADYQILLIKRAQEPFQNKYALPGGFIGINESLEDAARRELLEETGVEIAEMVQIHTFSAPDRDPRGRVISTAFGAIINDTKQSLQAGSDAADVNWFYLSDLPELAFDHAEIIQVAKSKMRIP
jgi:8-oxo-dGTP diphosphatase